MVPIIEMELSVLLVKKNMTFNTPLLQVQEELKKEFSKSYEIEEIKEALAELEWESIKELEVKHKALF